MTIFTICKLQSDTMPCFDTKEMKVAFTNVIADDVAFPSSFDLIKKFGEAMVFVVECECDMTVVAAFDGCCVPQGEFQKVKTELQDDHWVEHLTTPSDPFVARTA